MNSLKQKIHESVLFIKKQTEMIPKIGVILGSGLGSFANELEDRITFSTEQIPFYPKSTVPGHAGNLVFGSLFGTPLLVLQGRIHFYEGYTIQEVGYPVHVMADMGVRYLIVTNASGCLNPDFSPGDFVLITDHINFLFRNPLIGPPEQQMGARFPDMSEPYDRELIELAMKAGFNTGVQLKQGTFCCASGPTYETAAEIRMLRKAGVDVVSMSTVPEVIVAKQRGMRVLGISCIANMATGIADTKLSHDDVTQSAERVRHLFVPLLKEIVREIGALEREV